MIPMIDRAWVAPLIAFTIAVLGAECTAGQPTPVPDGAGRSCGTVSVIAQDRPTDPAALQVEQCFQTAYAACEADTTMILETHGVDTLGKTTFTIKSGSPCGISGVTAFTIVPRRQTTTPFTCARLGAKDGGLLFVACGKSGDIFVPPPAP